MLTKVNPAYMTRQISEIARNKNGVLYHITSLNPIRPENKPDSWEHLALESFELGIPEIFELIRTDTLMAFRYMAPLLVEPACLKCHAKQGYSLEKDMLFSIVAHDLRSHISGVHGLSKTMFDEINTFNTEDIIRLTGSIYKSTDNLNKLSDHMLQWYNTRKGTLDFTPEYFTLVAAVEETVELFSEKALEKEISFSLDVPAGMKVYADLHMVETILRNLISNALKYSPRGGLVEITAKDTGDNDFIEVIVKDNGVGMDQQTIDHLFEEDFHTPQPGTEKEKGTGLGLVICHEFIEKQKGTIRVVSTLNAGSQFILTLPKRAVE